MSKTKKQSNPYYKELLKKSEIKRIRENLTKKELTTIINVHYNFYWNCITDRNDPSANLAEQLEKYIKTPTHEVYETIFAMRRKTDTNKKVKRDESGKELFDEKLEIDAEYEKQIIEEMEREGVLKEPIEAKSLQ